MCFLTFLGCGFGFKIADLICSGLGGVMFQLEVVFMLLVLFQEAFNIDGLLEAPFLGF